MIAALMVAVAVALAAMVTAWLERQERQWAERNHVRAVERAELLRVEARRWELEAQRLAELHAAPHVTSYGEVLDNER